MYRHTDITVCKLGSMSNDRFTLTLALRTRPTHGVEAGGAGGGGRGARWGGWRGGAGPVPARERSRASRRRRRRRRFAAGRGLCAQGRRTARRRAGRRAAGRGGGVRGSMKRALQLPMQILLLQQQQLLTNEFPVPEGGQGRPNQQNRTHYPDACTSIQCTSLCI
jgi:hypothetical protein